MVCSTRGTSGDLEDAEAQELGRRSIYAAAHRDAYSGNVSIESTSLLTATTFDSEASRLGMRFADSNSHSLLMTSSTTDRQPLPRPRENGWSSLPTTTSRNVSIRYLSAHLHPVLASSRIALLTFAHDPPNFCLHSALRWDPATTCQARQAEATAGRYEPRVSRPSSKHNQVRASVARVDDSPMNSRLLRRFDPNKRKDLSTLCLPFTRVHYPSRCSTHSLRNRVRFHRGSFLLGMSYIDT